MPHTPTPWKALKGFDDDLTRWIVVQDGTNEWHIATVENGASGDYLETEAANARLIAAAPDLLEACQALVACIGVNRAHDAPSALEAIKSAIAKALGEG